MNTMPRINRKTYQTIVMIGLLASLLAACTSQPAPVMEGASPSQALPTQAPPSLLAVSSSQLTVVTESATATQALPSPTASMEPPMSVPETPIPVTAYEQLIGKWRTRCGAGPCTLEFEPDGKYRNAYIHKTETGITFIEGGKVTLTDGILHFVTTNGYCDVENQPNGYYTAAVFHSDNNLYLVLTLAPNDECPDRRNAYTRDMKFLGE